MTNAPSPLASPMPWDLVAGAYANEIIPQFELFAKDALELAGPLGGKRIADIACGPGTLAMLAAPAVAHVEASDFSPQMLEQFRVRLAESKIDNVTLRQADGQSLPYLDRTFGAAFSMFGLMFFPDRVQGLREMKRVLEPGAPAIVSSWKPFHTVPALTLLGSLLREVLPDQPFGQTKGPLSDPDDIRAEFSAAGLTDVEVHSSVHGMDVPNTDEMWASFERTMAPMVLLRRKLGEAAWAPLADHMRAGFRRAMGDGPARLELEAWIARGVA
jgi:SAM-dependent methyltransferase